VTLVTKFFSDVTWTTILAVHIIYSYSTE